MVDLPEAGAHRKIHTFESPFQNGIDLSTNAPEGWRVMRECPAAYLETVYGGGGGGETRP